MNFEIPQLTASFYFSALPIFVLGFSTLLTLLLGVIPALSKPRAIQITHYLALLFAFGAVCANFHLRGGSFLGGSYIFDSLAIFGQGMIAITAIVMSLLITAHFGSSNFYRGEIVSLFHMLLLGMLVMVSANEMISVFVGLELASIGLYALIGYISPSRTSQEGAVKYLILGSFASAFFLFGLAFVYAGTGTLNIPEIITKLPEVGRHPWMQVGALFMMVGLAFKLALAPFHLWAPDAYEASPTALTAFMATAVKVMVLVVVLRLMVGGMEHLASTWGPLFMFGAVLSTIFGNLLALVQSSLKRMLAYSSVSHAGYMAIALCAISSSSKMLPISSILFYLIVYTAISLGAFALLMSLETESNENIQLVDLTGLASQKPWTAFALAATMFSFAGIPPTAGFMGKLFVFNAALLEGLYGLVIIGIIGSVISFYYYLRVIVYMYMQQPVNTTSAKLGNQKSVITIGVVTVALAMILLLGTVFPGRVMDLAKFTTSSLMSF